MRARSQTKGRITLFILTFLLLHVNISCPSEYQYVASSHAGSGSGINRDRDYEYFLGQRPSTQQNTIGIGQLPHRPLGRLPLTKLNSRSNVGPPQIYRPDPAGSFDYSQYILTSNQPTHLRQKEFQHPQPNKPIVLKVSSKKTRPTKLPPLPPPFYAPSPDRQLASQKNLMHNVETSSTYIHMSQQYPHYQEHGRARREVATVRKETKTTHLGQLNSSDQISDGSDDSYWGLTSPFILFDNYEKLEPETLNGSSSDPVVEEQRFFPSFPSPNPYLGLNPYASTPSARPPLFPLSTANRAPSRFHSQFGNTKYASIPPNRGPSGVYSAESHDHEDRYPDNNLLGSGNFEVVRGGTFHDEDDGYHPGFHHSESDHHQEGEDGDYYHHNGHSSPSGYRQPGSDFFANFRDFADINPPSRSFSHNYEMLSLNPPTSKHSKNINEKINSRSDSVLTDHTMSQENDDPMMATY